MARSEIGVRFGENLRRARRRARISQEALGRGAGLHRTEIGFLEQGQRRPRIDTLIKLASSLEVPVDELLDGIDWVLGPKGRGSFWVAPVSQSSGSAARRQTVAQGPSRRSAS